jgi:hypothetical protein
MAYGRAGSLPQHDRRHLPAATVRFDWLEFLARIAYGGTKPKSKKD